MSDINDIFRERMRERRKELGLTYVDIGKRLNMSYTTIMRYEDGTVKNPKLPVVQAIAEALYVDPLWLIGETDDPRYQQTKNEVALIAEELHKDPELRMLFSLAKDAKPEDLQMVADMLRRFKEIK